jgi:hypothetical protein
MMWEIEPTKRNIVSLTAKFFDLLGIVSPVTVLFNMFFQELCESRISWDEGLTGELLKKWKNMCSAMSGS